MNVLVRRLLSVALAAAACAATARQQTYREACDASAAVALGGGRFVVADDEGDVLRIYERGRRAPVDTVDLIDHLRNRTKKGKNAEADLEGAAAIGTRIYWISSHALKGKDGEVDPHRHRFFATDIVAGARGASVKATATEPYTKLLDDLLADAGKRFDVLAQAVRRKPEDENGLNIEGLAAAPGGGVLIGFRNPLPQRQALIVPLQNPAGVIDSGAKPVFGDLIRLDLGGRGIRSIERVGNDVLIVAGPFAKAPDSAVKPAFALYRWNGSAAQAPSLVRELDEGSFRPEALFADAEANELLLLSDDGDEEVGGDACKDKRKPSDKSFRARAIAWP